MVIGDPDVILIFPPIAKVTQIGDGRGLGLRQSLFPLVDGVGVVVQNIPGCGGEFTDYLALAPHQRLFHAGD